MEAVNILAGSVRVRHGDNVIQFTVLVRESPAISLVSPAELHLRVEEDINPFLDSPLLRCSLHEDAVASNVVLNTFPPPFFHKKKIKKKS
jgi:hypothetical protein